MRLELIAFPDLSELRGAEVGAGAGSLAENSAGEVRTLQVSPLQHGSLGEGEDGGGRE